MGLPWFRRYGEPSHVPEASVGQRSFVPIGATVWGPSAFVVHPSLPVNTLTDFIDYVRMHPGTLNWSNPGSGSSQHLNTAIFLNATKLNMVAVPYGGQPPGLLDLMANRVQFALASVGLVTPFSGRSRPDSVVLRHRLQSCRSAAHVQSVMPLHAGSHLGLLIGEVDSD
jgi:tripartite-type tricarboxylate transporter receptor subunit TctC